jgi:zinc D-Ala-D-Ala carboxypeptidase
MDKEGKKDLERHRNYPALKYFTFDEFDSPDKKNSGFKMCPSFLLNLERAREISGVPFVINSGYRTKEHNKKVGGVENSSHTKIPCQACDIKVTNNQNRYKILKALIHCQFNRIGIAKNFIHVDMDAEKSPLTIWTYY